DAPTVGRCGRYIVIKHSYPNGRSVFTRNAQLGRIVGGDGKRLAVGMHVKKDDKIGEVGSSKLFHFEVRPEDGTGMAVRAAWSQRYAADSTMQWSRFKPVDPKTFDFGTDSAAK